MVLTDWAQASAHDTDLTSNNQQRPQNLDLNQQGLQLQARHNKLHTQRCSSKLREHEKKNLWSKETNELFSQKLKL